jgi:hypothetical protein
LAGSGVTTKKDDMSSTLMVWKPQAGLTQENAHATFAAIAEGAIKLPHDPALAAFLADLLADLPALEVDPDRSPWAVTPVVADGHIALGVSGDMINTSCDVWGHALRHGLVAYDPQIDVLYDQALDDEATRQAKENRRRAGEIL